MARIVMKNPGSGFSLIELLVVIAILGVLAAIAVPNLASMLEGQEYETTTPAIYTLYDCENGIQTEIGRVEIGEFHLWMPKSFKLNESKIVKLYLIPNQSLTELVKPISEQSETPSTLYYQITDSVILYPAMAAILKGASFRIDDGSEGYTERLIEPDESTEWTWNICPIASGSQMITIEIFAPIKIEAIENEGAKAVFSGSYAVVVKGKTDWILLLQIVTTICAAIGAFVIVRGAVIGVRRVTKKKVKKSRG